MFNYRYIFLFLKKIIKKINFKFILVFIIFIIFQKPTKQLTYSIIVLQPFNFYFLSYIFEKSNFIIINFLENLLLNISILKNYLPFLHILEEYLLIFYTEYNSNFDFKFNVIFYSNYLILFFIFYILLNIVLIIIKYIIKKIKKLINKN